MKPTSEQQAAIDSKGNVVRIRAFAGTGKTSTLKGLARARPKVYMLYLAFNKSVQLEAAGSFPSNVLVKTAHSLAYKAVGFQYEKKLVPGIKPFTLLNAIDLTKVVGHNKTYQAVYATRICEALNRFIASDDDQIEQHHIKFLDTPLEKNFSPLVGVRVANAVWSQMCDKKDHKIGMTHDGYLKLHRMTGGTYNDYDLILLDEGQDSSPVTMAMFDEAQTPKIIVGDQHQSIYQFRGAVNAMDMITADEEFSLTNSFRFGSSVALVANMILHLKNEEKILKGLGGQDMVGIVDKTKNHAFISRSNATVFAKAMENLKAGRTLHFLGGPGGYRLDLIKDAYYLKIRERGAVKNPFLKSFESFLALEEYVNDSDDIETKSLVGVVNNKEYAGMDLSLMVERIIEAHQPNPAHAVAILMTGHKSKGLEFDNVVLDPNFTVLNEEKSEEAISGIKKKKIALPDEDLNLVYVAATRAKRLLECPVLMTELKTYRHDVEMRIIKAAAKEAAEQGRREAREAKAAKLAEKNSRLAPRPNGPAVIIEDLEAVEPQQESISEKRKKMRRL